MSTRHVRSVAALALAGTGLLLSASCSAPDDATPGSRGPAVERPSPRPQTSVRTLVVQVAGMKKSQGGSTWMAWPHRVKTALEGLQGVEKIEMDLVNDRFRVTLSPDGPDADAVIAAIDETGFTATKSSGAFHADAGDIVAPQGDAVPEPIRSALVRAADEDKLVLVDFFAEWCGPCKRMLAEVYSDERVAAVLGQRYVFLEVDTDAFPDAGKPYGVSGIPDARILAADGRQVGRIFGYQPADAVLELLAGAEKAAGRAPVAPPDARGGGRAPAEQSEEHAPVSAESLTRTVLRVEGMTWPDGWGTPVRRALEGLEGVESVVMRFDDREFDVVHDATVTTEVMVAAVKTAGYEAAPVPQPQSQPEEE